MDRKGCYLAASILVTIEGSAAEKTAEQLLRGKLKRKFPAEHLNKTLSEIKEFLKGSKGKEKRALQIAKKLLEQQDRLSDKLKGR